MKEKGQIIFGGFQVPREAPGVSGPPGGPLDGDGADYGRGRQRSGERDGAHHGPAQPSPEGPVAAEHLRHAFPGSPPHDQDELPPDVGPRPRPHLRRHARDGHAGRLGLPQRDGHRGPPQRPPDGLRQQKAEHHRTAALHPRRRRGGAGTADWEQERGDGVRGGARQAKAKASEQMARDLGKASVVWSQPGGPQGPALGPPPFIKRERRSRCQFGQSV